MIIKYKYSQCQNCLSIIKKDKIKCKKCENYVCKYCKCSCVERKQKMIEEIKRMGIKTAREYLYILDGGGVQLKQQTSIDKPKLCTILYRSKYYGIRYNNITYRKIQ